MTILMFLRHLFGVAVKAPASRVVDLGSIPAFAVDLYLDGCHASDL